MIQTSNVFTKEKRKISDLTIKKYDFLHDYPHKIKAYYYSDTSSMLTFSIEY